MYDEKYLNILNFAYYNRNEAVSRVTAGKKVKYLLITHCQAG
jgi:hypothetical protein